MIWLLCWSLLVLLVESECDSSNCGSQFGHYGPKASTSPANLCAEGKHDAQKVLAALFLADVSSRAVLGSNLPRFPILAIDNSCGRPRSEPLMNSNSNVLAGLSGGKKAFDKALKKLTLSLLFRKFLKLPQEQGIKPRWTPRSSQTELAEILPFPYDMTEYAEKVKRDGLFRNLFEQELEPNTGHQDQGEAVLLRPLLFNTQLQDEPLQLVYNSRKDGFSAKTWHSKVDLQGPCLIVAKTQGGALCGAYAAKGFAGQGEYRGSLGSFLFTWPDGDTKKLPLKINVRQKSDLDPATETILDNNNAGPQFGEKDFVIMMQNDGEFRAISKLGGGFQASQATVRQVDTPLGVIETGLDYDDELPTLFSPNEGGAAVKLTEVRAYVGAWADLRKAGYPVPFSALLSQL